MAVHLHHKIAFEEEGHSQGQCHVAIKCTGFGTREPGFEPRFYHLLALRSWNVLIFAI